MILTRSKQILGEIDDSATACITFWFSFIILLVSFLFYFAFCGCPAPSGVSPILKPLKEMENQEKMKWSELFFNWYSGTVSEEVVEEEENVIDMVEDVEKNDKSNSLRELFKTYLAGEKENTRPRSGFSSYFAAAEPIHEDRHTETRQNVFGDFKEIGEKYNKNNETINEQIKALGN